MTTQRQVRDWWNRNPMSYDVDAPIGHPPGSRAYFRELDARIFHPRYMRLTVAEADGRPFSRYVDFGGLAGMDLLEVGCGSGIAVQLFAEAGANVTAVDLTSWAVGTTRARLEAFGLEGEVREADGENLPFPDMSFDLVFSWGVIHHTSDTERALAELVRVCRPGGTLVLMLYHRRSLFFLTYRALARFLPLARRLGFHFEGARAGEREGLIARHFTRREVERMLAGHGLERIRVEPYGQDAELLPLPRRIRFPITERLPRRLKDPLLRRLGHQLAVTATKSSTGFAQHGAPAARAIGAASGTSGRRADVRLVLLTPAEVTHDVRARRAAAAALARGYDVVAACGRISGEAPVPLEGVRIERTGLPGQAHALWGGAPRARPRRGRALRDVRGLVRLARLLLRTAGLARAGRRLGPANVVHANDLDTLPAGYLLARAWGARLVYDAHELYSAFEAPAPPVTRRLTLAVEGALARRADAVVTVSDGIAEELMARLRLPHRPLVVVNAPAREERPLQVFREGPLRVVYQGRLGPGRDLDDLLAAAQADGVELSIRIPLADPRKLREAVAARGLDRRVKVLDPVPPDRVLEALAEFEVGLVFDRPQSRNSELTLPNKLFEYLMAGLAVVAPRLESLGPLLDEERVGLTFEPGRPDGLVRALEQLAVDRGLLFELRRRARALALDRLNADVAADALAAAWEDTVAGVR